MVGTRPCPICTNHIARLHFLQYSDRPSCSAKDVEADRHTGNVFDLFIYSSEQKP
jgi:hypothetical protein